jgi:long-subunit fatty acid transport protein
MKKVMLKTTISLAVAMASTQIFASGFALNEQSISGMGTGFAGDLQLPTTHPQFLATLPACLASSANK